MEDRELLELAAKSMGLTTAHKWNESRLKMDPPVISLLTHRDGEVHHTAWNPLNGYGAAFKLAEYHCFSVGFKSHGAIVYGDMPNCDFIEDVDARRAIVRAAAEIGSAMP